MAESKRAARKSSLPEPRSGRRQKMIALAIILVLLLSVAVALIEVLAQG